MQLMCEEPTYWWDVGRPAGAAVEPLRGVLFDLDGALAEVEREGRRAAFNAAHLYRTDNDLFEAAVSRGDLAPLAGLADLLNSLFFADVPVAVVSMGARAWVTPLVRQLIGDGIAETIVTPDDLTSPGREPDLHGQVLTELGIGAESALAVAGTSRGFRAARAAKVPTMVVTNGYPLRVDYTDAVEVRADYDGLLASNCEQLHRRWQMLR